MVSAIGSSTSASTGGFGVSGSIGAQIAALEYQLQAYQKQLLLAEQSGSSSSGQINQLQAQVSQLQAQITQLESQQTQPIGQLLAARQAQPASSPEVNVADEASNTNLPNAITLALSQSFAGGSDAIGAHVSAIENQLQACQSQLLAARQNSASPEGQLQIEQLTAQIIELENQMQLLSQQMPEQASSALSYQQAQSAAGHAQGPGHGSLLNANAVTQALRHEGAASPGGASSLTPPQQAALQSLMDHLFTALGHENSTAASANLHIPPDHFHSGAHIAANIQSLLDQLDSSQSGQGGASGSSSGTSTSGASDTLSALNSSFQNLLSLLPPPSGQDSSSGGAPTLYAFLQNLSVDLSTNQDISGVVINTRI